MCMTAVTSNVRNRNSAGDFLIIGCTVLVWAWGSATSQKVPGSIPGRVTGDCFRGIRQVHVPGVDSAFRNEYQDIPGGKDGRCVGLTLPT
jgi:hypothetical protein